MKKEGTWEQRIDREMQRYSQLVLMAIEARERELPEGKLSGKAFIVLTSEIAESVFKSSGGLKKHVDFVVSYQEGDRIKYSILKKVGEDEVELIEPAISTISTIQLTQFVKDWNATNNWLMMVRK